MTRDPDEFFRAFTSKPCNICGRGRNWQLDGQLQAVCYDCGNPLSASSRERRPEPCADCAELRAYLDYVVETINDRIVGVSFYVQEFSYWQMMRQIEQRAASGSPPSEGTT